MNTDGMRSGVVGCSGKTGKKEWGYGNEDTVKPVARAAVLMARRSDGIPDDAAILGISQGQYHILLILGSELW